MNVLEGGHLALAVRCPICEVAPGESCVESLLSSAWSGAAALLGSGARVVRAPHVYRVHAAEIASAVGVDDVVMPAVAVEDFRRYREECRVFGVPGVDRATWWARYSADYAWAVELAAPTPVTEQRPGGGAGGVSSTAPNHLGSVA